MFLIDTGESWEKKIYKLRNKLEEKSSSAIVLTALDDVACEYESSFFHFI